MSQRSGGGGTPTVRVIGTFGMGKSTVVRHLIGTTDDPTGFPAVAAGKTTIAPTVIEFRPGPYEAEVRFAPRRKVAAQVWENLTVACREAARGGTDAAIAKALLGQNHEGLRLLQVLGRYQDPNRARRPGGRTDTASEAFVRRLVADVRRVACDLPPDLLDDEWTPGLDDAISLLPGLPDLRDAVMDQLADRVHTLMTTGEATFSDRWPARWQFRCGDRREFLDTLETYTGNASARTGHKDRLGRLLTPLVASVEVSGPFSPAWSDEVPRLRLQDTQGLGHVTAGKVRAASLPPSIVAGLDEVDAVVLVDHGVQRVMANPQLVMRSMAQMGRTDRLLLLFTHMDEVLAGGGYIDSIEDAEDLVRASVNNFCAAVANEVGPRRAAQLRAQLETHTYFCYGLDRPGDPSDESAARTAEQLTRLLADLRTIARPEEPGPVVPVYASARLQAAVDGAVADLLDDWRRVVGHETPNGTWVTGEKPWQSVKALTRRPAVMGEEGYEDLWPSGDFRDRVLAGVNAMLEDPDAWEGDPDETEQAQARANLLDAVSRQVTDALVDIARRRVIEQQRSTWVRAAEVHGPGSTRMRALLIVEILRRAGAHPDTTGTRGLAEQVRELLSGLTGQDGDPLLVIR